MCHKRPNFHSFKAKERNYSDHRKLYLPDISEACVPANLTDRFQFYFTQIVRIFL